MSLSQERIHPKWICRARREPEVYRDEAADPRGHLTMSLFLHWQNGTTLIHQVPLWTRHCARPWGYRDDHVTVSVLKDRAVLHSAPQSAGLQEGKELVPERKSILITRDTV